MASKAKKVKAAVKKPSSKKVAGPKASSGIGSKLVSAGMSLVGGGGGGAAPRRGGRRRRGPEYWAKKVLVERLKKKYWRAKYGGK